MFASPISRSSLKKVTPLPIKRDTCCVPDVTSKGKQGTFQKIAKKLKCIDGIDETASTVSLLVPPEWRPFVSFVLNGGGTYAVKLGASGAASDAEESAEILKSLQDNKEKITKTLKNQIVKQQKDFTDFDLTELNNGDIRGFIEKYKNSLVEKGKKNDITRGMQGTLIDYKNNNDALKIQENNEQAMPFFLGAMTGMTGGMATSTLRSLAEIARIVLKNPARQAIAGQVSHGFDVATTGIFTLSQVAMVYYGLQKAIQGSMENKNWDEKSKNLEAYKEKLIPKTSVSEGDVKSEDQLAEDKGKEKVIKEVQEYIKERQKFNFWKNTSYGYGMAVSETGMVAGTLLNIFAASPLSKPILMLSVFSTIGFALSRIHADDKLKEYIGDDHDHEHNGDILQAWKNIFNPDSKDTKKPLHQNVRPIYSMHIDNVIGQLKTVNDNMEKINGIRTKLNDINYSIGDDDYKSILEIEDLFKEPEAKATGFTMGGGFNINVGFSDETKVQNLFRGNDEIKSKVEDILPDDRKIDIFSDKNRKKKLLEILLKNQENYLKKNRAFIMDNIINIAQVDQLKGL